MITEPRLTIEIDPHGAFLTEMPEIATARTQASMTRTTLSPRKPPTKLGIVGEIDVINGLFERMKAETKRINPDSPRTKQALNNLGIVKEECVIKKFEDFEALTKDRKMRKMLYSYYIGNVNDTISQVLKERDKIRRKNNRNRRSSCDIGPMGSPQTKTIMPATTTARTHFAVMDFDKKIERLEENKQNEIVLIEKQAMSYLESEREFLKKLEKMKDRQERAEANKKKHEEKKLAGIIERKNKYSESIEAVKRINVEKSESVPKTGTHLRTRSVKDFKEMFEKDMIRRISEHKAKEMKIFEEQKRVEQRIEEREQQSTYKSALTLGHFLKKDAHSRYILEKEVDKKKLNTERWKEKYSRKREHVLSANFTESPEMYNKYAEKMKRFEDYSEKIQKERAKLLQEKKKNREEQFQKVGDNLQMIQRDLDMKEELLEEKIYGQTERLEHFYTMRQELWDQKVDLSKFKSQRSQIHFDKIRANENHKCNIIMAKNKMWKDAYEQKLKEKEILRNTSMQNHWNVQAEKDSLNFYLDQVNKIHAPTELIAGRLKNATTTFNVQHMANYIYKNFNTTSPTNAEIHRDP